MISKFKYEIFNNQIVKMDWVRLKQTMISHKNGIYELLDRPEISWDTDRMRRYFHGPVLEFVEGCERNQGRSTSKAQIKIELKTLYGPMEEKTIGTKKIQVLKSTADYTFEEYKKFLKDIKAFCMDNYQCEMPTAEEVE